MKKQSLACRLIYCTSSFHRYIWADILASQSNSFPWAMSRKNRTVQSIVICCSASPSDVTNIFVWLPRATISPKLKAPRPFRHWCYLASVFPSWPSMKDEPLYISSLSLWMDPKLNHHSNGSLADIPRDILNPQIAWKRRLCVWQQIVRLWKCVFVCVSLVSPPFVGMNYRSHCHGIYDEGRRVSQTHTWALSSIFEARRNNFETTWWPHAFGSQTRYHFPVTLLVPCPPASP